MFPKVAILVLNYNGQKCLLETLASLNALTYPHKEIWVIDNGSHDTSLARAQKEYPDFSYLPLPENIGFAGGMNRGMAAALEAGADFFWLFNYDALAEPQSLTYLIEAAEANSQAGLLSPGIFFPDKRVWFAGGKVNFWRMRTEHNTAFLKETPYESQFLTGCALLIRKEALETTGFLDEDFFLYYEDADYSLRASRAGFKSLVVPRAQVFHREESQYNPHKTYYLVLSGLIFFKKHAGRGFRLYQALYVTIRTIKNRFDRWQGRDQAESVRQAYDDFLLFLKSHDHTRFR